MNSDQLAGIGMTSMRTRKRLVERLREAGISNERVLEAVLSVPRHIFLDEALASRAYEDTSLPIGQGQTISQPYIVARMTELLLAGGPCRRVLEIGTGSGYQAAILGKVVDEVYTVERVRSLMTQAMSRLFKLGYGNIRFRHGDGSLGWSEHAPYDGILVTAAPPSVPEALLEQLAPEGRMIIPVGAGRTQELQLITRAANGFARAHVEAVSFVPLLEGQV
jgi:protein-L-isoaspartate(D-aspartate) O-methyltransferase